MNQGDSFSYDDSISRKFLLATVVWGVIGMLAGLLIALQMAYWPFNFDVSWLTFGRLRPLHTNAVIFAFAGNAVFCAVYYSTQRLLKARMFSDLLSKIHFWGWQLIIVSAAITLPLGITVSKEYAELEWPIDVAITLIWVVFAINFFGTLVKRRERHIYVAIWFYIATIITVAVLHIVNSLALPVHFFKSYSVFAGVQDALVQWWYGHNAVAFFLTTPFLGLMYYFLPKAAERPVFSYRLSIIHFWSLVFLYIWAGPHHLLYTALPEWAQTLGVVFSIMLIAPSWGGMINGLLTLRGAWDRLRDDPILKFFVVGITFYGMSTFEGPMMSLRAVNSLSHYTDYTIGHVHGGALGWNGFMAFAMIYWLTPRLWKTKLYSTKLATTHFWLATIGIVLYMTSMWTAGITQGLMWKTFTPEGQLKHPEFIETVVRLIPYYWVRAFAGGMYIFGLLLLCYNLIKKIGASDKAEVQKEEKFVAPPMAAPEADKGWHRLLEAKPVTFSLCTFIAILIGGIIEIVPMLSVQSNVPIISSVKPYTPLELEGRDIYIREGCYTCHSQMIRPFRDEVVRYGEYSKAGEFIYDRPYQWGSRRIGPDLHRVGGKFSDFWHYRHMLDPRSTTAGSIMPNYPWLYTDDLSTKYTQAKLQAMQKLGVPYSDEQAASAVATLQAQATKIRDNLISQGVTAEPGLENKEIIALIAYLQRLGTDIKAKGDSNE